MKQLTADKLNVKILDSRDQMGQVAAHTAAQCLRSLLAQQDTVNIIFAAAPSQNETLHYLAQERDIDWQRVNAFHMDEYIGLPANAPQAFGNYLREHIFSLLPFGSIHYLNGQAENPAAECARYSELLRSYPVDMVCLGIGENGHIAFNDPGVADFDDPALVKIVPLDEVCRQQQVNDGCFASIEQVPTHAMTLTIPALMRAKHLFCTVPAATKAWAIEKTVNSEISAQIPATIMRRHDNATLFCDPDSASALLQGNAKMKIAFAGLRHSHIFALAQMARENPHTAITGYWEEDAAARAEAQAHFTEPAYESYEALLSDPQVDVVAIGDYYGIRGQRIIQALKAGKHILADKPLCTSLEELDEIEALSHKTGLKIGCMLDLRYDPALRLAQTIIGAGELGQIHALSFTGQHPLKWGTRPAWYFEEGKHGGTLNDIAIHGLDAVHMITGMPYAKTHYVRQWNAFATQAPRFCDCAQFVGEMENGAGLMADVSYSAPNLAAFSLPSYWRFAFWGESGWLECRLGENAVTVALATDSAPRVVQAPPVSQDYLTDLMHEIAKEPTLFQTQSVLDSTRIALKLQQTADIAGKDESK